jgi:MoaA/NifB/PqqE/SkfB family radical SAM enzyme
LDSAVFERDMKRLAELSGGSVGTIKLMGGEPLLHPQKEAFFEIARRYFPQNRIELVTNGILLEKQSIDFWHSCHKNAITIVPTKYPLKIDWESIIGKAKTESVSFNFYSNEEVKTSYHIPFDIAGTRDTTEMFMHCFHANNCRELLDGRLYTCTVRPHARHFNKAFGKNMVLSDDDSIDIHQVKDMREILEFLAKPVPFCRYCNVHGRTFGHPWGKSSMEQNEWT